MTKFFTWETPNGTFNSKEAGLFINKINRALLPPITTPTVKTGKRAGEVLQENTLGSREITIDVTFYGETEEQHRKQIRELASTLYYENEGRLTLSDEQDVFYYAQLTGSADLESFVKIGEGTITFLCGDPYAYERKETEEELNIGENNISNEGQAVFPVLEIELQETKPFIRIDNDTTDQQIIILNKYGALTAGTKIIIDNEKNLVYNAETKERLMRAVDLTSDFFYLNSGTNEIAFKEQLTGITARLRFRQRYL